ncbi:MAG: peptidase [Gammaproteobacteria bacterium RIFCSPHIGHO2_12_FULL_38_11]|nr:MAG: peptidase [Gammaproteobacteria bacterium RIFCSPHIGHO2_12_FULL_38_11]
MMTIVIVFGAIYAYMEFRLPDVSVLNDAHMQVPLRVYTSDGKLIAQYGARRRIPVPINQVPTQLIQAILATEDARFYSHPGVDFIGLVRASVAVIASGHKVQGASTITMQVARNFFLTKKKTYSRKIKEILLALKIDKTLSKEKILELYLNKVYFGSRAYGVAAAAQVYYGKKLNQLTLPEMAMIAGLPQAPSRNNPLMNPKNAMLRRDHVLKRMLEVGFINQKTYQKSILAPNTASYHEEKIQVKAAYAAEMVRQAMVNMYGEGAYDSGLQVYTTFASDIQLVAKKALQDGLMTYSMRHGFQKPTKNLGTPSNANRALFQQFLENQPQYLDCQSAVVLSLDQQQAHVLLANGSVVIIPWIGMSWARPALDNGYVGASPTAANQIMSVGDVISVRYAASKKIWQLTEIPKVQGAMVVLNPQDGAILAIQGGFSFQNSSFNRAIQAERQPGSNFKPFYYSAALEKGFTLSSIINDSPIMIRDTGENAWWRPENDDMKFNGPMRFRLGLEESRNLVSIRILSTIGIAYALDYLSRFGFNSNQLPHSLSLALGSGVLTPLQIAIGYSVFANGGYRVTPYFIQKIVDEDHKTIYLAQPKIACSACITNPALLSTISNPAPEVITPQNAYLMTQILRGVINEGTGKAAKILNRSDLAGKTGTTNRKVDAWFSGFNSNLLATVWVGFDNSQQSLNEFGADVALPIWIQFMKTALQNQPEATMSQPADIISARIDPNNGRLAKPGQKQAIFEVFEKGHLPNAIISTQHASNSSSDSNLNNSASSSASAEDIF